MNNPFRETVEDLLAIWYRWSQADKPFLGTGRCSPMFRDTKPAAGNVHDDDDVVAARIRCMKARAVDECIDRLPGWKHRVAVELHIANRIGPKVWRNARLTPEELTDLWQEARGMLTSDFEDVGLLETEKA